MFSKGWGDEDVLRRLEEKAFFGETPKVPDIRWHSERFTDGKHGHVEVRDGTFRTPFRELPQEIAVAYVRLLSLPRNDRAVLIIAGSREEGFGMRQAIYEPLVSAGTDVLLLETPYYGVRRHPALDTPSLPMVSQQTILNIALIEEGRSLAAWMLAEGYGRVGVAGYSMGGSISALIGSTMQEPLAITAMAAGLSAAPVMTEHMLSWSIDYRALGKAGRERLRRIVHLMDVAHHPPPKAVEAAIVVGCLHDGYIPADQVQALHASWPGSELRWLSAGHISALFTERRAMRAAVTDSLDRLRTRA